MNLKHSNRLSQSYLVLAAVIVVLCGVIGFFLVRWENARYLDAEHGALGEDALHVSNSLRERLFAMELVAERLASQATGPAALLDADMAGAVERLLKEHPEVLLVSVAPGLKIRHVAPLYGNEDLVGLEYWKVPQQFPGIARAYRDKAPVFTGPLDMQSRGKGYFLHYPVFVGNDIGKFWGMISIAVSQDGLFSELRPDRAYAFREVTPIGKERNHLYGDPAVFEDDPVVQDFSMLRSEWQIGSVPRSGWSTQAPNSPFIAGSAFVIAVLLALAVLLIRRFAMHSHEAFNVLSHAIESLDAGFVLFDRNDKLVLANTRMAEFYNAPPGHMEPGITYEEFVRDGARRGVIADAAGRVEEWVQESVEAHRAARNGVEQLVDGRWLSVFEAKTPEGYSVGVRSDVSIHKAAEDAAESANRQKSEFMGNATHELRTPLTVISGHAGFVVKNRALPASNKLRALLSEPEVDPKEALAAAEAVWDVVADHGEKIASASGHLLVLVNNLLDWARAEGDEFTISPEPVWAGKLTKDVVEEMKHQAARKGISLMCMCSPARVMADPARLRQVLYNLIGNAIKFTDQGSVTVTVRNKGQQVIFAVEDTGCGIASENFGMIFERFQQVDGSDTRAFGGFGLGLTISKKIVEMHGGALLVNSKLGEGSRFEFDMPRTQARVVTRPLELSGEPVAASA